MRLIHTHTHTLAGIQGGLDTAKERISQLEYIDIQNIQNETQREKKKIVLNDKNTSEVWDNFKCLTGSDTNESERVGQGKYLKK